MTRTFFVVERTIRELEARGHAPHLCCATFLDRGDAEAYAIDCRETAKRDTQHPAFCVAEDPTSATWRVVEAVTR